MGFDFVVVGGGSAGATVAARLVETGARVCLVEAGPDYGPFTAGGWPADMLDPTILPISHDWDVNGEITTSRARLLGGCSAHNGCWCVRPTGDDIDRWVLASQGAWSPAEVEAALTRAEAMLGPIPVAADELSPLHQAVLRAAPELGVARLADVNAAGEGAGIGVPPVNIRHSARWNTAFAYLDARRAALVIESGLLVDRLEIVDGTVTGVVGWRDGAQVSVRGDRVVLCAGAYGTPAIMLRSGIGPEDELRRHGIRPVAVLPGVGVNLADHVGSGLTFAASDELIARTEEFVAGHRFFPSQVVWRTRSPWCGSEEWDQFILPIPQRDTRLGGAARYQVVIQAFTMATRSRGRVTLRSTDPAVPPVVDQRFLTDEAGRDLEIVLDGLAQARRLAATSELAPLLGAELLPGRDADPEDLIDHVFATVRGYWHPTGTAGMLPAGDPLSVTSPTGLVHGFGNLHVADASVIPAATRANTNLPVVAVAELLAARIGGVRPATPTGRTPHLSNA